MSIFNAIKLIGGLGLFLYGMKVMGDSLEKVAGNRLKKLIEVLTSHPFKGLLVGTVVTGIIQSSSATTVMVVGFVNSGIMTLAQSVGVIMGANIGTTVTAQILRLGDISSSNTVLQLLKPSIMSFVFIAVGIVMVFAASKKRTKSLGEVFIGFGVLFVGMVIMEESVAFIKDLPNIKDAFATLSNPLFGVLVGTVVTAIIQSSSASVGILQAVASTGLLKFSSAAPIILGQNIGTCITAILSSIGTNKNAKRAAMIHLYFNLIGTALFLSAMYFVQRTVGLPFWNNTVNRGNIADFHTLFNVSCAVLFLPVNKMFIWLANKTIRESHKTDYAYQRLDDRLVKTPSIAVGQCQQVVAEMGMLASKNLELARRVIFENDLSLIGEVKKNEDQLDESEAALGRYLTKITGQTLSDNDSKVVSELFHLIGDYERIGDYCENLCEVVEDMNFRDMKFSKSAYLELNTMIEAVVEILNISNEVYQKNDDDLARRVEPLEEVVDMFKDNLRSKHVERLKNRECDVNSGIQFVEMINNLERIADHCSNIAVYVLEKNSGLRNFDVHNYLRDLHSGVSKEYLDYFTYYKDKYYGKLETIEQQ